MQINQIFFFQTLSFTISLDPDPKMLKILLYVCICHCGQMLMKWYKKSCLTGLKKKNMQWISYRWPKFIIILPKTSGSANLRYPAASQITRTNCCVCPSLSPSSNWASIVLACNQNAGDLEVLLLLQLKIPTKSSRS